MAVQIDDLQELRFDSLVYLALCQKTLKDPAARQTMAMVYRTYPEQPVTLAKHTTDGEQLWNDVRKDLAKSPRGVLVVSSDNPKVDVYLDEVPRGHNGTYRGELLPATYRVLARDGATAYRFDVDMQPGATETVSIVWDVQRWLALSDTWFGFLRPGLSDENEPSLVRATASMFGDKQQAVYVVALVRRDGHWYLTGKVYADAESGAHVARSGRIEVAANGDGPVRAFAKFLHDGERTPDIQPLGDDHTTVAVALTSGVSAAPAEKPDLMFSWITGGLAATMFALGGVAFYLDGRPNCFWSDACDQPYHSATAGWLSVGTGAALAGLSVYWYVTERRRVRPSSPVRAAVVPMSGGAITSLAWDF